MPHQKFHYKQKEELEKDILNLSAGIDLSDDFSPLFKQVRIGKKISPNAFAVLPMEGCDSEPDGSPSDLVFRRYRRFAEGGAGLLWCEANAVAEEGKANPLQMMITRRNLASFKELVRRSKEAAWKANGFRPLMILQLTHSGRYSRPAGHSPRPLIAQRDPVLDSRSGVQDDSCIVSDRYLDDLIPRYVETALLCQEAGFDGVDIKACHRYLISELLSSRRREGKYGGSFENRSRFLLQAVSEVKKAVDPSFILASRFNVFDAHPFPWGFGCSEQDMWTFDPEEPVRLVKELCRKGINLLSNSAGNPYYIYPQVTRPFDISSMGIPVPDEHPLISVARLFRFSETVQKAAGTVPVVGNGYTWLRQFLLHAGAASLKNRSVQMIGLGRSSFAYPDAPRDAMRNGRLNPQKVCITCSKCTQIMRDHGKTGCVIRDAEVYKPLAAQCRREAQRRNAE